MEVICFKLCCYRHVFSESSLVGSVVGLLYSANSGCRECAQERGRLSTERKELAAQRTIKGTWGRIVVIGAGL